MIYQCKTRCCTFRLEPLPEGRWGIFVGDDCYSSCSSIKAAIDDIRSGVTGHDRWDDCYFDEYDNVPEDIHKWEIVG